MNIEQTFVLFHDDSDGFASAVSVMQKYPEATYIRVQYNQPWPAAAKVDKSTRIVIVDFSYSREILDKVYEEAGELLVIDHHDTAEEQLRGAPYAIFDMTKSGARLCWEYFNPGKEVPEVINLVEDRDLWRFKNPDSKAFECAINASGKQKDLSFWNEILYNEREFYKLLEKGVILLEHQESFIQNFLKDEKYKIVKYRDWNVAFYNAIIYISELGDAINQSKDIDVDFTISYFITKKGEVVLSFRGSNKNDLHLGKIAKEASQGQGGGHPKAAGCVLPPEIGMAFIGGLYSK